VENYVHVVESQTFRGEEAVYQNSRSVLDVVMNKFSVSPNDILVLGGKSGTARYATRVIIHAPLMGWKNFPIVQRLKADFGKTVCLDNDGNLGALAEQRRGEAKGLDSVLYMTVSTGCGGGIVINRKNLPR